MFFISVGLPVDDEIISVVITLFALINVVDDISKLLSVSGMGICHTVFQGATSSATSLHEV